MVIQEASSASTSAMWRFENAETGKFQDGLRALMLAFPPVCLTLSEALHFLPGIKGATVGMLIGQHYSAERVNPGALAATRYAAALSLVAKFHRGKLVVSGDDIAYTIRDDSGRNPDIVFSWGVRNRRGDYYFTVETAANLLSTYEREFYDHGWIKIESN